MEITLIPKFIINKLVPNEQNRIHLNFLLSNILILILIAFVGNSVGSFNGLPHVCLFRKFFGIPCPGCGITRSLIDISRFDLPSSWQSNPVGIFIALFVFIQIVMRPLAMIFRKISDLMGAYSKSLSNTIIISLFLVWIIKVVL